MTYLRVTSIVLLGIVLFAACQHTHETPPVAASFGIYLTRDNVPPASLAQLSHIEPSDEPILSLDDVISYSWSSHVLRISDRAKSVLDTLSIPVSGKSFCVCVNKTPKYCGAFWTPISSISFVGTTIFKSKPFPVSLRIGRGYPSDSDTSVPDPRNNSEVEEALRAAGKLR